MSEETIIILSWLLGWLILSIGFYIYKVFIDKDNISKKLIIWRSFWTGMFSWMGIFIVVIFLAVGGILAFNEWVEDKLS